MTEDRIFYRNVAQVMANKEIEIDESFLNDNGILFSNYSKDGCCLDYENLIKFNMVCEKIIYLRQLERRKNKLSKI